MPYWWDETSFLLGTVLGAIIAGIFGYLLHRVRLAKNTTQARLRPQWVNQSTHDTPAQVVRRSIRAFFQWIFWGAVLVGFVGVIVILVIGLINPF